jgi:hypothetical protein
VCVVITMTRTICPQVKGLYYNNNAPAKYPYLLIPNDNPNMEYWAVDAFECNKAGVINPDKQTPEPHVASDFGDYYPSIAIFLI